MSYKKPPRLKIENARIIFRNFSGKGSPYNREGDRNFNVVIEDPDLAQTLIDEGWNLRQLPIRNEGDEPNYRVEVKVSYKVKAPVVVLITGRKQVPLDEESINTLDFADIQSVDLMINPSAWEVNGKSGIKAYLDEMYVVIRQDEFAEKYADYEKVDN
jgi:hypothetical protein